MTKNIFSILKICLITIEGIRSDTLDLTQIRIWISRIKFFQTQKHDRIRAPLKWGTTLDQPEVNRM